MNNRRPGFIYTIFAIFMLGLTFAIVASSWGGEDVQEVGEKFRIDEMFYFHQSTLDDLDRASNIIGRRALTSMTNHIVTTGDYLDDGPAEFRSAFENGTVNGSFAPLMNQSTITNWTATMQDEAEESGYKLNLSMDAMDTVLAARFRINLNTSYRLNLSDPIARARFDKVYRVNTSFSYSGIEDPFILVESAGRYTNVYRSCHRDTPAVQHATGNDRYYDDDSQNWTSGPAVTRETNGGVSGVTSKDEKIAVVSDLCTYTQSEIENEFTDFAGVVSEAPAVDNTTDTGAGICGNPDVDMNGIIDDAADATSITNSSMTVMTEDEVWQNDIQNWTQNGCYVPDPWGPTMWGRMEGRKQLADSYTEGITFFINIPELPAQLQETNQSAVDYVYFNETGDYGTDQKIKGVTNEDLDWFRLDQDHADHWNMNPLVYE